METDVYLPRRRLINDNAVFRQAEAFSKEMHCVLGILRNHPLLSWVEQRRRGAVVPWRRSVVKIVYGRAHNMSY